MEKWAETLVMGHEIVSIVSDRGAQFTSQFWQGFQDAIGMNLKLSMAFHPQIDGQSE